MSDWILKVYGQLLESLDDILDVRKTYLKRHSIV